MISPTDLLFLILPQRVSRRFAVSAPLSHLHGFVASVVKPRQGKQTATISTSFPRKVRC